MTYRARTALAVPVLCALSICAFAAANASAEGLTAVECEEVGAGNGNYNNNHCVTPKTVGGEYDTRVITGTKEVEGTDTRTKTAEEGGGHGLGETNKPVAVLHFTAGGVELTITCGKGNTTGGSLMNKEEGGEMRIHVTGVVATWSECHVGPRTKPAKACKVQGTAPAEPVGSISTNPLTAITEANHKVVIKSEIAEEAGTSERLFTKFTILAASTPECFTAASIEVMVNGEAWGRADTSTHSHLTLDEVSNKESPLRVNGLAASQTETVTGFTKGNKEATVGAETLG